MRSYKHLYHLIEPTSEAFHSLQNDVEGAQKYAAYLRAAQDKLQTIERSLGALAGTGEIDEEDFSNALSDVRRLMEECCAGGWRGFCRQGEGYFGSAVNLDVTLRSLMHSLGDKMLYHTPAKAA